MSDMLAFMMAGAVDQGATNQVKDINTAELRAYEDNKAKIENDRNILMEQMRNELVSKREAQDREWRTSEREASEAAAAKQDATRHSQALQLVGARASSKGDSGGGGVAQTIAGGNVAETGNLDDNGNPIKTDGTPFVKGGATFVIVNEGGKLKQKPLSKGEIEALNQRNAEETAFDKDIAAINGLQARASSDNAPTGKAAELLSSASGMTKGMYQQYAKLKGEEGDTGEQDALAAANQMESMVANYAVAEATANGQSGVNTQAEVDRIVATAPRIDRSNPQRLRETTAALGDWLRERRTRSAEAKGLNARAKQTEAAPAQQQPAASSKVQQPAASAPSTSGGSGKYGSKYGY